MRRLIKSIIQLAIIFLLLPHPGIGQNSEPPDSLNSKLVDAAREIMNSAGTCAFITIDPEGRPRVREMDPFPPEDDFTVWLGTNPRSRKVEQINYNPRVTLYYQSAHNTGYVMIYGTAELVNEPAEKARRWKDDWAAFYPDKANDYLLIRVSPEWMEVLSYLHGIVGDPVTWEPPRVTFEAK